MRANLPNGITAVRILLAPVVAALLLRPGMTARILAFAVFLVAALSDLWDGHLARSREETTAFGEFADPLADKLLLAACLIPFYLVTTSDPALAGLPLLGVVPLWAVLVLLGREVLVTAFRALAAGRGETFPAGPAGKVKAFVQNVFNGAAILWIGLRAGARDQGWTGAAWRGWETFHGWVCTATLLVAVALTLYSLAVYLRPMVALLRGGPAETGSSGSSG